MPKKRKINKLEKALEIKSSSGVLEFVKDADGQVEEAINARTQWSNDLIRAYKIRKGQIGRPNAHLPFKDAADIRYPIAELFIRKIKPIYVRSLFDAPRLCRFYSPTPEANESAARLEHFENHTLRNPSLDLEGTATVAIDGALESGKCVTKITWLQRWESKTVPIPREEIAQRADALVLQQAIVQAKEAIQSGEVEDLKPIEPSDEDLSAIIAELMDWSPDDASYEKRLADAVKQYKSGKETIAIIETRLAENRADVRAVSDLASIIVPANTTCLAEAEWIAHDVLYSERELRAESMENGGKYRNVNTILDDIKSAVSNRDKRQLETWMNRVDGVNPATGEIEGYVTVRELYCWIPRNLITRYQGEEGDDETKVRAVVTYVPCGQKEGLAPLRIMEFPYEHGRWPFAEYNYNFSKARYYDSRGVPLLTEAFYTEYCIAKNASLNRTTLMMSPPTIVNEQAKISPNLHRQIGQVQISRGGIPASEAVHVVQYPDLKSAWELDARDSMAWAEQIAGLPDLRSLGNYAEAPTAEQTQQTVAPSQQITGFELSQWFRFWGEVFSQVYALQKQYQFTEGMEGALQAPSAENPTQFVRVTKADFEPEYIIRPGGDIHMENPMLKAQKQFVAAQFLLNDPRNAPFVKPYNVVRGFATGYVGYETASDWLRTPDEAKQLEPVFMQMQAQAAAAMQAGKANPSKKVKQLPNARAGMVPQ